MRDLIENPAVVISAILLGAVILGGALIWKIRRDEIVSDRICADHGMTMTELRQGSGKTSHSAYVCRNADGQLFSF